MWTQRFNFKESSQIMAFTRLCCLAFGILIPHLMLSDALIRISDYWRYAKGSEIGLNDQQPPWYSPDFNDLSWNQARGGFVGGGNTLQQATRFSDFGSNYHSVFFRTSFEVSKPEDVH